MTAGCHRGGAGGPPALANKKGLAYRPVARCGVDADLDSTVIERVPRPTPTPPTPRASQPPAEWHSPIPPGGPVVRMVTCLDCGHFQPGVVRDGAIEAIAERCERCGGSSFEEAAEE